MLPWFACSKAAAIAFSEAASELVPQKEKVISALSSAPLLAAGWLPVAQPAASRSAASPAPTESKRWLRDFMRVLSSEK